VSARCVHGRLCTEKIKWTRTDCELSGQLIGEVQVYFRRRDRCQAKGLPVIRQKSATNCTMRLEKQERHSSEWKSSAESAIAITVQRPQKKKRTKQLIPFPNRQSSSSRLTRISNPGERKALFRLVSNTMLRNVLYGGVSYQPHELEQPVKVNFSYSIADHLRELANQTHSRLRFPPHGHCYLPATQKHPSTPLQTSEPLP
jgi:hypothetical protein